ncbi:MAG: mechanosensitive ion channel family protein [Pseudomonadota bacterium]
MEGDRDTAAGAGALETLLLGFSMQELLLAGFALLVAIAGRFLFAEWGQAAVRRLTARTASELDDKVAEALLPPLTFLPVVVGVFLAIQALNLQPGLVSATAESLTQTLFAVTVFWALLRLVEPASAALSGFQRTLTPTMKSWVLRAARVLIWLIAGATVLELWGVRVLPVIAGLGLLGVAVALGAQDLFKNLISGLLILTERRFCQGDWVKVDGVVEGVVEEIGFRSTKIRRFDRAPVHVPNAAFADDAVINFGEMTHRRISWTIGLEYRTTAAQLAAIREKVEAAIQADERFVAPPDAPQFVRLSTFSDSSIDLMIYVFTRTTNWGEWLAIKEELLLKVKQIVEGEGAGFAFPSTSLYVERSGAFEEISAPPTPPTPSAAASPAEPGSDAPAPKRSTSASGSTKPTAAKAKSSGSGSAASKGKTTARAGQTKSRRAPTKRAASPALETDL